MPPLYPHYKQWSPNSCAIECIRMAVETLKGDDEKIDRSALKSWLADKGIYYSFNGVTGTTFGQLDAAFKFKHIAAVLRTSSGPHDLALTLSGGRALSTEQGNAVCLVAVGNHVVVVDRLVAYTGNQYQFQVRDPAGNDVELQVPGTDPRIAGVHSYWLVSS